MCSSQTYFKAFQMKYIINIVKNQKLLLQDLDEEPA
jgi:hypothetical protein